MNERKCGRNVPIRFISARGRMTPALTIMIRYRPSTYHALTKRTKVFCTTCHAKWSDNMTTKSSQSGNLCFNHACTKKGKGNTLGFKSHKLAFLIGDLEVVQNI